MVRHLEELRTYVHTVVFRTCTGYNFKSAQKMSDLQLSFHVLYTTIVVMYVRMYSISE